MVRRAWVGLLRVLRVLTAAHLLAHVARIVLFDAPYLRDPLQLWSNVWRYLTARQRLRDDHDLSESKACRRRSTEPTGLSSATSRARSAPTHDEAAVSRRPLDKTLA